MTRFLKDCINEWQYTDEPGGSKSFYGRRNVIAPGEYVFVLSITGTINDTYRNTGIHKVKSVQTFATFEQKENGDSKGDIYRIKKVFEAMSLDFQKKYAELLYSLTDDGEAEMI